MKEMSTSTHSAPLRDKRQASGSPFSHSAPYWERCAGKSTGSTDDSTGRATHLRFCRLVEDDRHFEAATSNRRSHSLAIRCERKD
ncbi:hypothetical protein PF003_g31976 [Phytophthora fragariae]|nr:hypothetical protein PF003_g31976 [Phytophthora fragariae]